MEAEAKGDIMFLILRKRVRLKSGGIIGIINSKLTDRKESLSKHFMDKSKQ